MHIATYISTTAASEFVQPRSYSILCNVEWRIHIEAHAGTCVAHPPVHNGRIHTIRLTPFLLRSPSWMASKEKLKCTSKLVFHSQH